jgi:hypothetical protein
MRGRTLTIRHIQQQDDALAHRGSRGKHSQVRTVRTLTGVRVPIGAVAGFGDPLSCPAKPRPESDRAAVTCSHHYGKK